MYDYCILRHLNGVPVPKGRDFTMNQAVQHVFLVGAKSFGGYGGYETFINKLTEYHQHNQKIQYHVTCKANGEGSMDEHQLENVSNITTDAKGQTVEFFYHNAHCFKIPVPDIGNAQAIYYDVAALLTCCKYIEQHHIPHPIIYIMACRIGPFMPYFRRRIRKFGGAIFINPDGHEWMRTKWHPLIRKYWKASERWMVKYSDLVICDSVNIENYIHSTYDARGIGGQNPRTVYIAYGAEVCPNNPAKCHTDWQKTYDLTPGGYYLLVGRFVPENNHEIIIREFLRINSRKQLIIVTTHNDKFLKELEDHLHFSSDGRIRFMNPIYDQTLLMELRKNAWGYLHGHEVGGTNPSLLEAMGSTNLNLLLDINFNREVARDTALYWTKEPGNLAALIDRCDRLPHDFLADLGMQAKKRIRTYYSWPYIAQRYAEIFCSDLSE